MLYLFLNWTLGTTGLALLSLVLPGFRIGDFQSALIAVAVVALVHAAVSTAFRPGSGETVPRVWGVVLVLADTIVFRVVALLVPGYAMLALYPALAGGMVLLGVNLAVPRLFRERHAPAQPAMNS
jgi:uncharacterized membrane protein YvlD (DUF360 family)